MSKEIERKFLVVGEYKEQAFAHSHIEQGYFPCTHGRTVRIRIRDDKGFLTIKGPSPDGGLSRYEFETEIPLADAKDLMKLCIPGRIDKIRWLVKSGQHTVEVDEFFGGNAGLVVAEIELGSEDEAYIKPDFLGKEVTEDRRYYNTSLMLYPYALWKDQVEQADK